MQEFTKQSNLEKGREIKKMYSKADLLLQRSSSDLRTREAERRGKERREKEGGRIGRRLPIHRPDQKQKKREKRVTIIK